jgi:iron complex outermembrane receptor protein
MVKIGQIGALRNSLWLGLIRGIAGSLGAIAFILLLISTVRAETTLEDLNTEEQTAATPSSTLGIEGGNAEIQPVTVIPHLGELEQPATTIADWVAQIEASLVQITDVRVEVTEAGLQVILETAEGSLEVPETRSVGNALIADISNAAIAEDFSQADPIEGIALVSVTSLPGDRVRVAITGTDAPPVAEVRSAGQGLVLGVSLGDAEAATEEDAIQVVVTGEQEGGYYVPNTSVGTRTDTPLRDIPQSIQIIPQEVLRDQNITTFNEALRNVPGVAPFNPSQSAAANLIIRGFPDFNFANNFILRNGLREAGQLGPETTPDLERIEVLKDPASVLYGAGSPGGSINLVTKQPLHEPFYAVDATIGNYNFYRGAIDLSGPLNDSRTVLYRLNTSYLNRGSFIDSVEREQIAIAPVVSVAIGERTRFTLEGSYTEANDSNFTGVPAVGTVLPNPNGRIPRNRQYADPDFVLTTQRGRVGYRLEHQFSDNWSLQNSFRAGFRDFAYGDGKYLFDASSLAADNRTLNGIFLDFEERSEFYDLNVNLTGKFSTGTIQHQIAVGVDLARYDESFSVSLAPGSFDLFNPVYREPAAESFNLVGTGSSLTDTLGIYIQDQVILASNLKFLLGGRFDLFEQTDRDFLADTTTGQSGNAFSPRAGIVYQPIEPISLYASYSRSFAPVTGRSFEGGLFQPERGTQYEVGVKVDVNDQFSTTLALYDLTRSNITTDDTRPGVPPGFSIQTGEQRSRGVELSVQGEILPGWNIIAGYAYTDARISQDNTLTVGNRLRNVPENAVNLWTTYEIQKGGLQGLGFGLGLFYVGGRQVDLDNSLELPSYLRTDAAIFYRRDCFRAALNLRNLFNIDYFESAFELVRVNRGEPFTVQGTISWQF